MGKILTVKVAASGVEKYIARCLDSFIDESYQNDIEVIVVNNRCADRTLEIVREYEKKYPNIFIAGQLSGVEGYVESISSGLYAGINMYNYINNLPPFILPNYTCIGGLPYFITNAKSKHFQPMNTNFGVIMSNIGLQKCKNKVELVEKSLNYINNIKGEINGTT